MLKTFNVPVRKFVTVSIQLSTSFENLNIYESHREGLRFLNHNFFRESSYWKIEYNCIYLEINISFKQWIAKGGTLLCATMALG